METLQKDGLTVKTRPSSEAQRRFKEAGPLERLWLLIEKAFNAGVTSRYNPFYFLGAISIFFLWIILISGIYLFLFYSISAKGAYNSVQSITVNQWYLGGVMRSLHRYAADGLIITMILHAARCFFLDRYKKWRWVAWVSGIAIAWIIWIGGIFGYWMVWDEKAKLVALLSANLIEHLPMFGLPLSLNFARVENLTDQLFYIILFIHFSSIFFLFILILVHISRVTKAVINPPKAMAYGILLALIIFSIIKPATSAAPADLKALPQTVPFDWFYMFIFPMLKYLSAYQAWGFIAGISLIVAAVPWLTRSKRQPPVQVTLSNCTGCELCMEDCPYLAIQMRKRTDEMPYPVEAVVNPKKCASCGICVGACDYKALNLPDMTEDALKGRLRGYIDELKAETADEAKVIVFACAKGAWVDGKIDAGGRLKGYEWARVVSLPCIGMLQPSMVSMPIDRGLDGVYIASCKQNDCHYRKGNEWLGGRLSGTRPPVVKKSLDRSRVRLEMLSAVEKAEFLKGLDEFQKGLKGRRA